MSFRRTALSISKMRSIYGKVSAAKDWARGRPLRMAWLSTRGGGSSRSPPLKSAQNRQTLRGENIDGHGEVLLRKGRGQGLNVIGLEKFSQVSTYDRGSELRRATTIFRFKLCWTRITRENEAVGDSQNHECSA